MRLASIHRPLTLPFALLALAAILVACGGSSDSSSAKPWATAAKQRKPLPRLSERFGVNARSIVSLPRARRLAQAKAIHAAGLRTVRIDILWHPSEPSPGQVDFSNSDAFVRDFAEAGIRIRPIIGYSAKWAASVPNDQGSLPRDIGAFARYAGRVAGRYGPGGRFWKEHPGLPYKPMRRYEIWNEPNLRPSSSPRIDPDRYAEMFEQAGRAIRAHYPAAALVVGGLGVGITRDTDERMSIRTFLGGMIGSHPGVRDMISAVAIHPYKRTVEEMLAGIDEARRAMSDTGIGGRPIEINEWGATLYAGTPVSMPEAERRAYFRSVTTALGSAACDVAFIAPYTWMIPGADKGTSAQHGWGIAGPDGILSSGRAYLRSIRELPGRGRCKRA